MNADAERVVDTYERHAGSWAAARLRPRSFDEQAWLDRFLGALPSRPAVLDLGCGVGQPVAAYLRERGCMVTGVDASPALLARFRAALPDQPAILADMRGLRLPGAYHGILAWDSLFHLDHAAQRAMFAVFRSHALPGAAVLFTSGAEFGEAIGELAGDPLYHASLAPDEYRSLLALHGFAVLAQIAADPDCGGRTVWLAQSLPLV